MTKRPPMHPVSRCGCTLLAVSALGCTAVLDFDRAQLPSARGVDAEAPADVAADHPLDAASDACAAGMHACGVVAQCRACCDHTDCDDRNACTVDTCSADGVCQHAGCRTGLRCCGGVCCRACDAGCAP